MEILAGILGMVVALATGKLLFGLFFEDASDFLECLRFSLTPDLFSLFRGEFIEDKFKSFKLGVFLVLTIGAGVLAFQGLNTLASSFNTPTQSSRESAPAALPAEMPE